MFSHVITLSFVTKRQNSTRKLHGKSLYVKSGISIYSAFQIVIIDRLKILFHNFEFPNERERGEDFRTSPLN